MQGLPFFPPADRDDAGSCSVQPAQGDPVAALARAMSPPHFPIGPDGLRGSWKHVGIEPGTHEFEGFDVLARDVQHKGGRAFGYRVTGADASLAYVPDALDANDDAILDLARDVDLFVRGAPFVAAEAERAERVRPRHRRARGRDRGDAPTSRRLVLTHHAPIRTDDDVDGDRGGRRRRRRVRRPRRSTYG